MGTIPGVWAKWLYDYAVAHAPFIDGGDGALERHLADVLKGSC